jgi:hypothetical protein
MDRPLIKLFPDYCSTGLWREDGCNVDPKELGISEGLQIALKYWHEVWEFNIAEDDDDLKSKRSQKYIQRWKADGKKLAVLMTIESDDYEFECTA